MSGRTGISAPLAIDYETLIARLTVIRSTPTLFVVLHRGIIENDHKLWFLFNCYLIIYNERFISLPLVNDVIAIF